MYGHRNPPALTRGTAWRQEDDEAASLAGNEAGHPVHRMTATLAPPASGRVPETGMPRNGLAAAGVWQPYNASRPPERAGREVAVRGREVAVRGRALPAPASQPRTHAGRARFPRPQWPLLGVLVFQAVFSARLVWSNTAFTDEALYLKAGHLEIAHWLHGDKIPAFPSYFSGAPVIYPPLGAMADSIGGLAAARILSLLFMLGATWVLWGTTSWLYGRVAAFFATALWSMIGPTLHVGAFATYDAMALFLLALAVWCAVRAAKEHDAAGWIILSGLALVLANATKYATILFDPVVLALAVLRGLPRPGGSRAVARGGMLLTHSATVALILAATAGSSYLAGLRVTTLARAPGYNTPSSVIAASVGWIGVIVAAAFLGFLLSLGDRFRWSRKLILLVLAAAALLAPVEQARMHTLVSLDKHVSFGAWFAAIAAGYGVSRLAWWAPRILRKSILVVLTAAVVPVAVGGVGQSAQMTTWPGAANLIRFIQPKIKPGDRFLAEGASVPEYYLAATSWRQWSNTFSITLPSGTGLGVNNSAAPFIGALRRHYFSFVILSYNETPGIDVTIAGYLRTNKHYRLIGTVPFSGQRQGNYTVWEYDGARTAFQAGTAIQPAAGSHQ